MCSPARTPTLGPCSTRPCIARTASALPQRPRAPCAEVPPVPLPAPLLVPHGGGFGLRFGAAGSVGTSCFGLFLLPGGLPRRFGSGAAFCAASGAACGAACGASCASCASVRSAPFNYTWSRYNTNDKDNPRSRTTLPSRSVRRKMCLRVTGPLRAMKCPSSEPVSTMVPTPLFSVILERMSSPRLPSALLALASWAQRR